MYVLSGTASAYATDADGNRHRLRQFSSPSWLGENGFLRGTPRSADVVADTAIEVATIDRPGFDRLRRTRPEVALVLLDDIAIEQAKRVTTLSSAVANAVS